MKYLLLSGCLLMPVHFTNAQDATPAPAAAETSFTGKVVETMNTAGYTYVLVDTGKKKVWAATTEFAAKVGDTVAFQASAPMENYHSKTLNRDFDVVYFAGSITVNNASAPGATGTALPPGHPPLTGAPATALPPGHPSIDGQTAKPSFDLTGIKPADGGKTIEQIYASSAALAGQPVVVRGKVVKYNAMILGKNWLHIRDGSGSADKHNHDLTVTTTSEAKLGDIVLVTGKVSTKKDFGSGYKFDVIMEDAQVTVEKAQ